MKERKLYRKDVVRAIFPTVMKFNDYLVLISKGIINISKSCDNNDFLKYFHDLYIVPEDPILIVDVIQKDSGLIKDILTKLVAYLVRIQNNASSNSSNSSGSVLTLGYRLTRWTSEGSMISDSDIECFFLNTLHSFVSNPNWQYIANCIGEVLTRRVYLLYKYNLILFLMFFYILIYK